MMKVTVIESFNKYKQEQRGKDYYFSKKKYPEGFGEIFREAVEELNLEERDSDGTN